MPNLPTCKITVIRRTVNKDLIDAYMSDGMKSYNRCGKFREGDEFFVHSGFNMPEKFCDWAWA